MGDRMRYKKLIVLLLLFVPSALYAQPALQIEVVTDRPDALYQCGDKATFRIRVLRDKKPVTQGEVAYVLSLDGFKILNTGKASLSDQPALVTSSLAEPGFLRCQVTYVDGKISTTSLAAAGF